MLFGLTFFLPFFYQDLSENDKNYGNFTAKHHIVIQHIVKILTFESNVVVFFFLLFGGIALKVSQLIENPPFQTKFERKKYKAFCWPSFNFLILSVWDIKTTYINSFWPKSD